MARLYPPVTEEVLSAFCLSYDDNQQEKIGASIKIDFNLNRAVANSEISGMALRLRTISTNQYVITENLNANTNTGKSEGIALSYNLEEGTCLFSVTNECNSDAMTLLKVGQFYKAQIAFIDLLGNIGYWSTVATIKCVAQPIAHIPNYTANDVNIFSNEIIGEYVQSTFTGDSSEKEYSYQFQLFDEEGTLIEDTGIKLHNSSSDVESHSSTDHFYCYKELNEEQSYYLIYQVTTINGLTVSSPRYQIIVSDSIDPEEDITLMVYNGYEETFSDLEMKPWEEGLIKITPSLNGNIVNSLDSSGTDKAISGNFVVLRSSSKDNFGSWQEVKRFRLNDEIPSKKIIYDYTVEQGISYRYAIQQYNRQQFYSKKIYAYKRNNFNGEVLYRDGEPIINDITADFEDMFLYDGKRQLKVRFNPKVNSFKNDLQEQKIDTIGSKHPFIFRNGNVCYKEFPISGLISFQIDNNKLFITDEDYNQMRLSRFEKDNDIRDRLTYTYYHKLTDSEFRQAIEDDIPLFRRVKNDKESLLSATGHEDKKNADKTTTVWKYEPIGSYEEAQQYKNAGWSIYKVMENVKDGNSRENIDYLEPQTYVKTDLTSENIMTERYFKLLVLDWLTDGRPKLFRSPTEGNYIVRLLNVSLTPKTELGRMIHEFTCTAYEIADFSYESLRDLGLLSIENINEINKQWVSKTIKDLLDNNKKTTDGYYPLNLNNKIITGFQCVGFAPGDKIRITIQNSPLPLDITIGTTGTYIYDEGKPITSILFLPIEIEGDFPRDILLSTEGYNNQLFDTIASTSTHTQIGEQIIGPVDNLFENTAVGSLYNNNLYYKSPNVFLYEDFIEVQKYKEISLSIDLFVPNKYYYYDSDTKQFIIANSYNPNLIYYMNILKDNYIPNKYYILKNKKYVLCTDEEYNDNYNYYIKNMEGSKLKVTELLHLHAKKREVIPIFLNGTSLYLNSQFMLTPFGQGYIKSKSIIDKDKVTWTTNYGNLSPDELAKSRSIFEIVDFVISKCNKDIFCLFEVYVPGDIVENQTTHNYESNHWVPFREKIISGTDFSSKTCGIYDPWLRTWQLTQPIVNNVSELGWWPREENSGNLQTILPSQSYGLYNPSIILHYEDGNNINLSLKEEEEIVLDNIKVPQSITIGNGAIIEPIYRLQCIDYTMEKEDSTLKQLRQNYLTTKTTAYERLQNYIMSQYAQQRGKILSSKYEALLQQVLDHESYQDVVKLITNNARIAQIEALKQYLEKEKNLIEVITVQIRNLDLDVIEKLGDIYLGDTYKRIYGENSDYQIGYNNYKNAYEIILSQEDLIPPIDSDSYTLQNVQTVGKSDIMKIIKHIVQNPTSQTPNYNFESIIDNSAQKFTGNITSVTQLLDTLQNKRFVSEYLDLINQEISKLFFGDIDSIFENNQNINEETKTFIKKLLAPTDSHPEEYPLAYLLYKTSFINNDQTVIEVQEEDIKTLQPVDILQGKWNNYYFVSIDDNQLPTISAPIIDGQYAINWNGWDTTLKNKINGLSKIYTKLDNNQNIIELLQNQLILANQQMSKGGNTQGIINKYNEDFSPYNLSYGPPKEFIDYQLGLITDSSYSKITKSKLENIIDNIYITITEDENSPIDYVISHISTYSDYTMLPNVIRTTGLEEYIRNYLTKDEENNLSPRDIYQQICSCIAYKLEHPNLNEDQIKITNITIDNLKANSVFENFLNNNSTIENLFINWENRYQEVITPQDTTNISTFESTINKFNSTIRLINSLFEKFINLRNRYQQTVSAYEMSDNIQEILQDELNQYEYIKQELERIKNLYTNQLSLLQKDVFLQGYIDFIESYLQYKEENTTADKNTYSQLLADAQAMAKAIVNEDDSPEKLQQEIDEKWKIYLDALAQAYYYEVKERFN